MKCLWNGLWHFVYNLCFDDLYGIKRIIVNTMETGQRDLRLVDMEYYGMR